MTYFSLLDSKKILLETFRILRLFRLVTILLCAPIVPQILDGDILWVHFTKILLFFVSSCVSHA